MKNLELGAMCKWFEENFSPENAIPLLPTIIRLDGVRFSKWTKEGIDKPFDKRLSDLMIEVTALLVKETNAKIGYTQSDEITLILYSDNLRKPIYHGGEKSKILSKLTSKLTALFIQLMPEYLDNKTDFPNFDCRLYQVPNFEWACKQLIWRERDAVRNSVSMLARSYFTYNECFGKTSNQLQDMLFTEYGVNWNDLEPQFKCGTYLKNIEVAYTYTAEELELLPEKHNAHQNPNGLTFKRKQIEKVLPPKNLDEMVKFIFG